MCGLALLRRRGRLDLALYALEVLVIARVGRLRCTLCDAEAAWCTRTTDNRERPRHWQGGGYRGHGLRGARGRVDGLCGSRERSIAWCGARGQYGACGRDR